jgi:hypothetical protein
LKLDENDLRIIIKAKIAGCGFLGSTKDYFRECGLSIGSATRLVNFAGV